ncbi:MAG: colanic acid biosynthesis glycosyl transferase WcaI [Actinomycetota bacterium]|jgi:colanic acid biosynthesis glycosyl transferase WcaI|nr:colanic acid biosynthesis glycosyl transferase WcaI [Actinomycetota bacterium]
MRVLFQVHHFPPDVNSTGLLMAQVACDLVARGHDVTVVTTMPHYEGFKPWPAYRRKLFVTEELDGVRVLRVWSFTSGSKSMIHRLLNYVTFNKMAALRGLTAGPADVIFCTNGSFFSGVTGRFLSIVKRAPLVYNVQDLYPEVPIKAGQLRNPVAIRILRAIARYMYRAATVVTVIAPSFVRHLASAGIPTDKIELIPNFVDTEFIARGSKDNAFSHAHDLVDRFVVSHAGNIGYVYDLQVLIEAAARLDAMDDLVVLIIGDGVARESLQVHADRIGAANVRFLPFQDRALLPDIRATSDVQVALYKPGAAMDSLPSKIYEIMASGQPVLASAEPGSDLHELVGTTGCGLCIAPGDVDALVEALQQLHSDPALRKRFGDNGRTIAETTYSRTVIVDRYEEIFQALSAR